jgi:hypothetical protein
MIMSTQTLNLNLDLMKNIHVDIGEDAPTKQGEEYPCLARKGCTYQADE